MQKEKRQLAPTVRAVEGLLRETIKQVFRSVEKNVNSGHVKKPRGRDDYETLGLGLYQDNFPKESSLKLMHTLTFIA